MYLNDSILRVFDVRTKPGKVEILKKKLSDTSVDVVKDEPGNLGFFLGKACHRTATTWYLFQSGRTSLRSRHALAQAGSNLSCPRVTKRSSSPVR